MERYGRSQKQFDDLGPNGEFLMEFSIYDAIKNGFEHIVVITKSENKDFLNKYLRARIPNSIKLEVLVQKIDDIPQGSNYSGVRKNHGVLHMLFGLPDML